MPSQCADHEAEDSAPFLLQREQERLADLASYKIMDTSAEKQFDHITRLACHLFKAPIALVSLVGEDRQFFKSKVGLAACSTDRSVSFCETNLLTSHDVLVVEDATLDPRFCENPLVTGEMHVRFYAGAPLITRDGHVIGRLCIIDHAPRIQLAQHDVELLKDLAALTMECLERRREEVERIETEDRFAAFAQHSTNAIICSDSRGVITEWNRAAEAMFGYSVQEAVGQSLELLIPAHLRDAHRAGMDRMARDAPSTIIGNSVEIPAIRRDGSEFAAEITLTQWERAGATLYGASIKDVTARKEAEAELFKLAHYDALTQAGNRTLFERDIKNAGENRDVQSMLMVDLDGFKTINDCFGHGVGDEILREAAQRIRFGIGDEGMLYRLGGDEFGIVVKEGEISAANDIADRVIELFNIPFKAHGKPMRLGASIGIARFEHTEIATALGNADLAMYEAKRAGGGIKVIYNDDMRRDLEARHSLQSELQAAFEAGEFRLYYQPQIDLRTGALKGAEALLRWEHPQRGLLNPGVFIDELEKSPVAAKVGSWIIREACRETARIRRHGANDFCIGVNLFAAQLKRGDLCAVVHSALVQNGLPATALELEITETTILDNEDFYVPQLRALRARGVRIAFDDYGTGWASLSLLKRYPLTRLKIDRSFVRDIPDDLDDAAIVKAVIAMADSLGLDVIAEGIETDRQEEFLRRNACETGQGFLYGQPMPVNEFLNLIAAKSFFTAGVEVQRYG